MKSILAWSITISFLIVLHDIKGETSLHCFLIYSPEDRELIIDILYPMGKEHNTSRICLNNELLSHTSINCSDIQIQGRIKGCECKNWLTYCTATICCFDIYYHQISEENLRIIIPHFSPLKINVNLEGNMVAAKLVLNLQSGLENIYTAVDFHHCISANRQKLSMSSILTGNIYTNFLRKEGSNCKEYGRISI